MVELTSLKSQWLCWCGHGCSAFCTLEPDPFRNEKTCVCFHQLHSDHIFLMFSLQAQAGSVILSDS